MRVPISRSEKRFSLRRTAAGLSAFTIGATLLAGCEIGFGGNDNTAAKILPGDTIFFASAALSPSNDQKLALWQLSQKLPEKFRGESEDKSTQKAADEILSDSDLNWDADVKPWIDGEAAVAVLPAAGEEDPAVVALLKTKDEAKTRAAFDKAEIKSAQYAFVDKYAVVSLTDDEADFQRGLDAVVAGAASDTKLADDGDYKRTLESLSDEHLLLGFIDTPAILQELEDAPAADSYLSGSETDEALAEAKKVGAVGFNVYASSSRLVLEATADQSDVTLLEQTTGNLFKSLPDDTLGALSIGKVGSTFSDLFGANGASTDIGKVIGEDSLDMLLDMPQGKALAKVLSTIDGDIVVAAGSESEFGFLAETSRGQTANTALAEFVTSIEDLGYTVQSHSINGGNGYTIAEPASSYSTYDPYSGYDSTMDSYSTFDDYGTSTDDPYGFGSSDQVSSDYFGYGQATDAAPYAAVVAIVDDNTIVVANTIEYAEALAAKGDLGGTQAFKDSTGLDTGATFSAAGYADVRGLYDLGQGAASAYGLSADDEDEDEDGKALAAIVNGVGFRTWADDDREHVEISIAFR